MAGLRGAQGVSLRPKLRSDGMQVTHEASRTYWPYRCHWRTEM